MSLLKEEVVSPSERETVTLVTRRYIQVCNVIMELFVTENTGVNLDAHRLGTGYR